MSGQKILQVLESRNRCLKKIVEATEQVIVKLEAGNSSLDLLLGPFDIWRNNAIKTLKFYDNHIAQLARGLTAAEKSENFRKTVINILDLGENLIYYILSTDNKIRERIRMEKFQLLKDLAIADQSGKTVGKFRSEIISKSGGKLDGLI